MIATPSERAICRSSAMTLSAEFGSRLATGSSATMSRGCCASARNRHPLLLSA
jgi:hypothetical protein